MIRYDPRGFAYFGAVRLPFRRVGDELEFLVKDKRMRPRYGMCVKVKIEDLQGEREMLKKFSCPKCGHISIGAFAIVEFGAYVEVGDDGKIRMTNKASWYDGIPSDAINDSTKYICEQCEADVVIMQET